jgi:hypothetical protein
VELFRRASGVYCYQALTDMDGHPKGIGIVLREATTFTR